MMKMTLSELLTEINETFDNYDYEVISFKIQVKLEHSIRTIEGPHQELKDET